MNRRRFLIGGVSSGAFAAGYNLLSPNRGSVSATGVRSFGGPRRQMPIPPLLESTYERPIELTMTRGQFELLPGIMTPTTGFNGHTLAPQLECARVKTSRSLTGINFQRRLQFMVMACTYPAKLMVAHSERSNLMVVGHLSCQFDNKLLHRGITLIPTANQVHKPTMA